MSHTGSILPRTSVRGTIAAGASLARPRAVAQDWGDHPEIYLDEKTGAGIWRVQISHEFLKDIRVDVDLSARRFHATGLGCIADIALPR